MVFFNYIAICDVILYFIIIMLCFIMIFYNCICSIVNQTVKENCFIFHLKLEEPPLSKLKLGKNESCYSNWPPEDFS